MTRDAVIRFADFRLDPHNAQLWCDTQVVRLKPKAFAVLHCLVAHAGQLVTKDTLWQTVWPDVTVSDDVLAASIRDIRKALGDHAKAPRFIETVHRRGYRFLHAVTPQPVRSLDQFGVESREESNSRTPNSELRNLPFVGRDTELAQLHQLLARALNGERQIVFVTGEPGIGKTTLLDVFLSSVQSRNEFGVRSHEKFGVKEEENQATLRQTAPPTPNSELSPTAVVWVAGGQCIEQFGKGEAYLPLLTALGQLGYSPVGSHLIEVLKHYAPSWLVQMPALVPTAEFPELRHRTTGTTRPRMLRELADALEVLTAELPLILVLEDLHWSDLSTLELLSFVAKRNTPARLMILGSYRPVEMLTPEHPLRAVLRELRFHHQCEEVLLPLLSPAGISEYLALRNITDGESHGAEPLQTLAHQIYQRTEGNPLFMVSLVNDLETRGVFTTQQGSGAWQEQVTILTQEVPNNIRQFVTDQCDRLMPAEQRLLEAASLAGMTFSTASVAAALDSDLVETEERCARLAAQQRFLHPAGIVRWPDGTVAAGYGFLHALYQQLWHERVTVSKLQQFHLRIGTRKELAYGDRASEIAAELAMHFEQGRDYHRAVQYLGQAGQNAIRRNAPHEAIALLSKGLKMLSELPDSPERVQQELTLQISLGAPLMATKGFAAPEVRTTYTRALELCQQREDTPQVFPVRSGLWLYYMMRAELQTAREIGMQMLAQAERSQDTAMILQAHHTLWPTLCWLGEFPLAREHLERGMVLYNQHQHHAHAFMYGGHDPGTCSLSFAARVLWALGYPDQAARRFQESLILSEQVAHPFSLVNALFIAAPIHQFRREIEPLQKHAEAQIAVCQEQGFAQFLASGTILRGWAQVAQGNGEAGLTQMRQAMTAYFATGAELWRPYFLALLAETYGKVGQPEEGLRVLGDALVLVDATGERYYEAEAYRLKGELLLAQESQKSKVKGQKPKFSAPGTPASGPQGEAEACFLKAIAIARKQGAKSWELRATMSLVRLRMEQSRQDLSRLTDHTPQNKLAEAHRMLSDVYNWFTEGFDTADLRDAKMLLEALSQ